jgi:tetratricopeptide (TPR) repeat protein
MTGSLWCSAFVAAVFAVHPLRAESVAWVSERKDVLSGFCFILTIAAYVRWVRKRSRAGYWAVVLLFALGLMAKSMVATLPFVLLLLDYWPLGRMGGMENAECRMKKAEVRDQRGEGGEPRTPGVPLWELVKEKIPLFLLSIGSCFVTALVPGLVVPDSFRLPFLERISNALVSYVVYLRQMVFPAGLATPYPIVSGGQPLWKVGLAILLLAAVSAGLLAWRKKQPCLLAGWLWYLGMLVPVIGIVQISFDAAHSDRYTYLPGIGLAIAGTWAVADWSAGWRHRQVILGGLMMAVIGALAVGGYGQTSYWKDDPSLWTRALDCTVGNIAAHNCLGGYFLDKGEKEKAIEQYREALRIKPDSESVGISLGEALVKAGKLDEAVAQYRETLRFRPDSAAVWNSFGMALAKGGRYDDAIASYRKALKITPRSAAVYDNLGLAFFQKGDMKEAIDCWQQVLEIEPDMPNVQNNLAWLLATTPDSSLRNGAKAVALAEKANKWERGGNPIVLHSLAAAYAETGRYGDAARAARRALELATAQTNDDLTSKLPMEIKLYEAGRPMRDATQ